MSRNELGTRDVKLRHVSFRWILLWPSLLVGLVENPFEDLVQSCYLTSDPGSLHAVALPYTGWDSVSHFDNGVCFSHVPFGISKTYLHLVPLHQELELGVDSPQFVV